MLNLAHLVELRVNSRDLAQLSVQGRPDVVKIGRAARSRLQSVLRETPLAAR